jgi:hypothetical protein
MVNEFGDVFLGDCLEDSQIDDHTSLWIDLDNLSNAILL